MFPFERLQTVQPGQPVPGSLINAMQDGAVTLATNRRMVWRTIRAQVQSHLVANIGGALGDIHMIENSSYLLDLPVAEGEIVRTIRMVGSTNGFATMTGRLYRKDYAALAPGPGIAAVQLGATLTWVPSETETRKEIDLTAGGTTAGETIILSDDSGNPTDRGYFISMFNGGGAAVGAMHIIKMLVTELPVLSAP